MSNFFEVHKIRVIQHLVFWLFASFFWLFTMFVGSNFKTIFKIEPFIITFIFNACFSVAVYVNLYILIPYFLKLRKFFLYGINLILISCIVALFIDIVMVYPLQSFVKDEGMFSGLSYWVLFNFAFITIMYVGVTTFFSFVREWFILQKISSKLQTVENERLEAELKALKTQINPHFLFNTLNSIYSLALYKSDKTPDTILQLSDMMRYILYECNERYVLLEKELYFIRNYINLQRIRLNENVPVTLEIKGEVNNQLIAPLLLEPIIENAFKHGMKGKSSDSFINIIINLDSQKQILFEVINSYNKDWKEQDKENKGIGVKNVLRRLELLYPERHELFVEEGEDKYTVKLKLKLNLL